MSRQLKAVRRSDERNFLGERRKRLSCSEDSKKVTGAKMKPARVKVIGDQAGEEVDHTVFE